MAARPEDDAIRRRFSRKLLKRNSEGRRPTTEFPDRFKDLRDDADEDVVPPSQGPSIFMHMNQSIFGLIAAAGSTVDFNDRFEGQSSDEDDNADDNEDGNEHDIESGGKGKNKQREQAAKTIVLKKSPSGKERDIAGNKQRRGISGQLLQSLPQLSRLPTRSPNKRPGLQPPQPSETRDHTDRETTIPPAGESRSSPIEASTADREQRQAPVMSRMLEARAEMSSRPSFDLEGLSRDQQNNDDETGPSALARKLKDIFEFDHPEEVIDG